MRIIAGICLLMLTVLGGPLYAQGATSTETLFQKLQSGRTSRPAFEQFIKLGKKHSDVRKYLADRLPEKIAAGPGDNPPVWEKDVLLAGILQIVEAIPALVQHVDQRVEQGIGGLYSAELLEDFPAGRALALIGQSAIPALSSVLETGGFQKRWVASRALNMIKSTAATDELSKHLPRESDEKLRAYIEDTIQRRRAGLPH